METSTAAIVPDPSGIPAPTAPETAAAAVPPVPPPSAKRIVENVVLTLGAQLLSWAMTFVVTLFLPAYLKDTGLGALTLVGSFSTLCGVLVTLGTSTVLIKEVARDRGLVPQFLKSALVLRLLLSIPACGLGAAAIFLLGYDAALRTLILLSLGLMVFTSFADVFSSILRGLEEFRIVNGAALLERLLTSAAMIALVFAKAPLWTFVVIGFLGNGLAFLWQWMFLRRYLQKTPLPIPTSADAPFTVQGTRILGVSVSLLRFVLVAGMPYFTNTLFGNIYGNAGPLFLSKFSGIAVIGWFGLAKRLSSATLIIPVALASALLPTLARSFHENPGSFHATVQRMIRLLLISVVPFATVLSLIPGPLLELLHYPASFRGAIPVLVVSGLSVVLWYLSQGVGTALIAADRQGVFSRVTGIAAIISIPLCAACVYLTQRFFTNGAIGAMTSDALLEAGMVLTYIRFLPPGTVRLADFLVLFRAGLAILPTILLVVLTTYFVKVPLLVQLSLIGLGLLVYVPLCGLLRCFEPRDLLMVQQFLRKRTNG